MLPKGWKLQTVDDLFHVQLGKMLNQAAKEKNPQFKYLGNSNVRWGHFETNDLKTMYFSERELGKFALQKGDIILCEGGEVGRCAIWDQDGSDIFYQKALHRLRSKGGIHPEYFQSFMYFINGSKLLDDFTTRTSIAHLTREKLLKLPVKTPPLPEQRKIAQILSTWDKAIVTTEKLIAASQQQKRALMQQLLTGKKRFAEFSEEWKNGCLEDLCIFKGGSAFKEIYQGEVRGELPFIKVSDMNLPNNSKYIVSSNNWISLDISKKIKAKIFPEGSVVFAKVGAALLLNRRRILVKDTLIDNNMMAAMPSNSCITEYLYQFMLMIDFAKLVQEGAIPSINQSDLNKFKISYPEIKEQQKIAAVLTTADQEIDALQSKLVHLKQEKKALMQQLLTGKRRVVLDSEQ